MFEVAKRAMRARDIRKVIEPGFKMFADRTKHADYENAHAQVFVSEFYPIKIAALLWRRLRTEFCGDIIGGGWTNGFILYSHAVDKKYPRTVKFRFPEAQKLLTPATRVDRGCLVFHRSMETVPFVAVQGGGVTRLFDSVYFDMLFGSYRGIERDLELYFDELKSGVIAVYCDTPLVYLSRLRLPDFLEPLLVTQSERFYAPNRD